MPYERNGVPIEGCPATVCAEQRKSKRKDALHPRMLAVKGVEIAFDYRTPKLTALNPFFSNSASEFLTSSVEMLSMAPHPFKSQVG